MASVPSDSEACCGLSLLGPRRLGGRVWKRGKSCPNTVATKRRGKGSESREDFLRAEEDEQEEGTRCTDHCQEVW